MLYFVWFMSCQGLNPNRHSNNPLHMFLDYSSHESIVCVSDGCSWMTVTTRERLEDNCDPSVEVSYVSWSMICKMGF